MAPTTYQASGLLARILIVALFAGITALPLEAQSNERRDGNWWVSQEASYKRSYLLGLFDGVNLGSRLTAWGLPSRTRADSLRTALVVHSFDSMATRFLSKVTNSQLAEGLDTLYADYRNRRILVLYGTWLVLNAIAGTPDDALRSMTEGFRRKAASD
jgi:hypothetical protein